MYDAAGERRNMIPFASSSGLPGRPVGFRSNTFLKTSSSIYLVFRGVRMAVWGVIELAKSTSAMKREKEETTHDLRGRRR